MRLVDAAWAADNSRNAGPLEPTSLGREWHGDGAVRLRQPKRQGFGGRAGFRPQPRPFPLALGLDAAATGKAVQALDGLCFGIPLKLRESRFQVVVRQPAELPIEAGP